jgi:4'-phosphopantetheinyl transferase
LNLDEVHVWGADLDVSPQCLGILRQTLDEAELARAAQFAFERDRRNFVAAHGMLRAVLGRHLAVEPGQIRFSYGPHGKPALANGPDSGYLRFNMSHSGALALYAVARGLEVGVDVELVREDMDCKQIAERFFSPGEVAAIRAIPEGERHEAFFKCWTRKEACVKAVGEGLSIPLDRFEVSAQLGRLKRQVHIGAGAGEGADWWVLDLLPGPGYVAALAARGQGCEVTCRQWPEAWAGCNGPGP